MPWLRALVNGLARDGLLALDVTALHDGLGGPVAEGDDSDDKRNRVPGKSGDFQRGEF